MRLTAGLLLGLTLAADPLEARETLPVIDSIVVDKSLRRLYLIKDGETARSYAIALGLAPEGHKQREGDYRTPEGSYRISVRKPDSSYMLALQISYPNEADRARAAEAGVSPGGLIMIHGRPLRPPRGRNRDYYASRDWTDGCIAVSNSAMLEIWMMAPIGTPVTIRP
ncbi:L,D-transpeptidase family protein [Candidatus Foliamicus sp.]